MAVLVAPDAPAPATVFGSRQARTSSLRLLGQRGELVRRPGWYSGAGPGPGSAACSPEPEAPWGRAGRLGAEGELDSYLLEGPLLFGVLVLWTRMPLPVPVPVAVTVPVEATRNRPWL